MNDKYRITLKDLTLAEVKEAYKKTGIEPCRSGEGCALEAIAKSRMIPGWCYFILGNPVLQIRSFIDGFDGNSYMGYHASYYRRGQEIAKAVLKT